MVPLAWHIQERMFVCQQQPPSGWGGAGTPGRCLQESPPFLAIISRHWASGNVLEEGVSNPHFLTSGKDSKRLSAPAGTEGFILQDGLLWFGGWEWKKKSLKEP